MVAARTGALGALEVKGDLVAFNGEDLQRVPAGVIGDALVPDPIGSAGVAFKKAPIPRSYVAGSRVSYVSASQVSIAEGAVKAEDDTFDIRSPVTMTADITVVGANGLDVGVEAASTWYALYVIGDTTGVNAPASLLSASFVAPVIPAGYDKQRRVGCVRNDAASDFIPFVQVLNYGLRRYYLDLTPATSQVLAGGAAAVFTNVDLSAFVPPSSNQAILLAEFSAGALGAIGDELRIRPDGFSASAVSAPIVIRALVALVTKSTQEITCACPGQIIEYRVSNTLLNSADISVIGFDDEL